MKCSGFPTLIERVLRYEDMIDSLERAVDVLAGRALESAMAGKTAGRRDPATSQERDRDFRRLGFTRILAATIVKSRVYSEAVLRACQLLGGPDEVARRIGVSRLLVIAILKDAVVPPPAIFLKIVDIVLATPPDSPPDMHGETRVRVAVTLGS